MQRLDPVWHCVTGKLTNVLVAHKYIHLLKANSLAIASI